MAIHASSPASPTTPPPTPPTRPPFFLRTLHAPTSPTHALPFPLHPPSPHLLTLTQTTLTLHILHPPTLSLRPLLSHPLQAPPRAAAFLPHNLLCILAPFSRLFFYRLALRDNRFTLVGHASLHDPTNPAPSLAQLPPLQHAHLLALHPSKPILALATLDGRISVMPLLFLADAVSAGKALTHNVQATVLSLIFLDPTHKNKNNENKNNNNKAQPPVPPLLLALVQHHSRQQILIFTLHDQNQPPSRGTLSFTQAASLTPPHPHAHALSPVPHHPSLVAILSTSAITILDPTSYIPHHHQLQQQHPLPPSYPPPTSAQSPPPSTHPHQQPMAGWHYADGWRHARDAPPDTPRIRIPPPYPIPYPHRHHHSPAETISNQSRPSSPHITLSFGSRNGAPTAWTDASAHFHSPALYFATESGALFVLRTNEIDNENSHASSPQLLPNSFRIDFVGDVGPASSLAALDHRLIHIVNHCADGSLRKIHIPSTPPDIDVAMLDDERSNNNDNSNHPIPTLSHSLKESRYGLEVRQEFLNLAPISDFIIVPPAKRTSRRDKRPRSSIGPEKRPRSTGGSMDFSDQGHDLDVPDEVITPHRLDLTAEPRRKLRQRDSREPSDDNSAYSHTVYGSSKESEIIACCGFGRHGTIRMIRPGAPVTIFASSANTFPACNNIWPIRFTNDSKYDAGLLLTFAETTGILYSVPMTMSEQMQQPDGVPAVAKLVSGTSATNLRHDVRTIAAGTLVDGVLAQVFEGGIRLIYLKSIDEVPLQLQSAIKDGELTESICKKTLDWEPPDGGFISVAAIAAGCALVCVVRRGQQMPLLCLLKMYPDDFSKGVFVVATAVLDHELSSIVIPEWDSRPAEIDIYRNPDGLPIAVLGTYGPSIEVRVLGPTLDVLERRAMYPWSLNSFGSENPGDDKNGSGIRRRSTTPFDEGDDDARDSLSIRHSKSSVSRMTAIPESLCVMNVDGSKFLFAGLRDGSVICFSFVSAKDNGGVAIDSRYEEILHVDSHRKLGHRPVVVKSFTTALGRVVIGQTERPWICIREGRSRFRWIPLAFTESTAACGYSVLGAERCFAIVGADEALHICGLRRRSEVTVRSIHIGKTPKRVLALAYPEHSILVATSKFVQEEVSHPRGRGYEPQEVSVNREVQSELRIYDRRLRVRTGGTALFPGEQVHVMFNWLGFIVVGTSCNLDADKTAGVGKICKRGRLLLYSVDSRAGEASSSSAPAGYTDLTLCSEVVLPGAALAGAGHPSARVFVVSCNDEVIVFGVPRSRTALVEIARTTARALVVSISIYEDVICIVDLKDSVGFFYLESGSGKLIRDRCDHRRRIVSDAVIVDRKLAVAVDRMGRFFSIGYGDDDSPKRSPINWPDGHSMHMLIDGSSSSALAEKSSTGPVQSQSGEQSLSADLGEEYDVIEAESASEDTVDSNDQAQDCITSAEDDPQSGGGDGAGGNESAMSQDGSASGATTINAESGGIGDTQDGGTNTANPTASTEDDVSAIEPLNIPVITTALANIMNQATGSSSNESTALRVAKNLVCHHQFNMGDTALRIRLETFSRSEKITELEERKVESLSQNKDVQEPVFGDVSRAVFCGTLGGGIIAAVPMSGSMYGLLGQVETEMSIHNDIADFALGSSHKKMRGGGVDGSEGKKQGCIDGDLLNYFGTLSRDAQLGIAERVGCPGEQGVLYIEGAIRDLCDRVG